MKLITETIENVRVITESVDGNNKNYFIEGIFMQADTKNRNGRTYPKPILMNEVRRYINEHVNNKRAFGELNHPTGPSVNLDRVSHLITELHERGNDVYGKAKILDTPTGKIVKSLLGEGVQLGVSSRGMGSLKKTKEGINQVQEDFMLAAVDIVADPSAPHAFVNGIMEGKEWVWSNGVLKEQIISNYKKEILKTPSKQLQEKVLKTFEHFLRNL
jgi:hypothetical protein